MSIKLHVYQIPPTLTNEEFLTSFRDLKGFLDARLTFNEKINQIIGELEFINFESADHARKLMQSYTFPGASQGIVINLVQQQSGQYQQSYQNQDQYNNNNGQSFYNNQSQNQPINDYSNSYILSSSQQKSQSIQQQSMPQYQQSSYQYPPNHVSSQQPNGLNALINNPVFKVTPNATNSLYIDGVPIDASEREVALISYSIYYHRHFYLFIDRLDLLLDIFRPFPGFKDVRLIQKQTQSGRQYYYCFADFENSLQSTIALQTLQSYRFDKKHRKCLKIMYANEPQRQTNSQGKRQSKSKKIHKYRK